MNNAKKFFEDTLFDINLDRLYTLHSASNFAYFDKFCAIVLKVGPDMIEVVGDSYEYLFIVYARGGDRIW